MKTLCFTLGLLLIVVCCCDVQGNDADLLIGPSSCCFSFSEVRVPIKLIFNITKTHRSCLHKAFIVNTVRGKQICYRQTFQWALNVYTSTGSSIQKP